MCDTVTVDNQKDLAKYAGSDKPYVILLKGTIKIPKGHETTVKSNKTIHGIGKTGVMDGGGGGSDPDCIQMDNCHHIWIDHCHFHHGADGLIDSRHNTTNLTVSWTILSPHGKAFGIGWTPDVTAEITIHHTWFRDTRKRNPSADNILRCHMYNNFNQDNPTYGNYSRGKTNMITENSVYENVNKPHFADNGALKASGCIYRETKVDY